MSFKVKLGNEHAVWLASLIEICLQLHIVFWVENPFLSFLWDLECWIRLGSRESTSSLILDYCCCGAPWRKRTRIFTSSHLRGQRCLCARDHKHIRLVGWNRISRCPWTKLAQTYPRRLCFWIATAALVDVGLLPKQKKVDVAKMAKANPGRVGEASNPGPRRRGAQIHRREIVLDRVDIVLPSTTLLGKKAWEGFSRWSEQFVDHDAFESLTSCPQTLCEMVVAFGKFLFAEGRSLYLLRQLVTFLQRQNPDFRAHFGKVWQLIARWEHVEPLHHRTPLPYVIYQAMVALSLLWGWRKWAAITVLAFEAICRPGEALKGRRADLLLPRDLAVEQSDVVYLKILDPKPRARGIGKSQHVKIKGDLVTGFLDRTYKNLRRSDPLYPGSASSYRRRWDKLLEVLLIPQRLGITPASIRGGGAVRSYRADEDISRLLWRMRLRSVDTLRHYLQEVGADSVFGELTERSRSIICCACGLYTDLLGCG